ncbi:hypothetical protein Fleli_2877 [Bernardetia litoralis DSM 6794]|uniref:Uncharacterized protein n=1 Tax=Bernardetia litoralis (strain ATCC 23117 / DSM 6794 / NBRC 15988 / NCIMB 1366 / Fx l1 / Sio-4) TaxID=880071 RepID=I4AMP3_BERLS|nr:hypothetical protein [Bernardetia litoralis]AFM05228.1 hypothetical protein Fleli_2877 [Bernardetia litoralis DSM 6794]
MKVTYTKFIQDINRSNRFETISRLEVDCSDYRSDNVPLIYLKKRLRLLDCTFKNNKEVKFVFTTHQLDEEVEVWLDNSVFEQHVIFNGIEESNEQKINIRIGKCKFNEGITFTRGYLNNISFTNSETKSINFFNYGNYNRIEIGTKNNDELEPQNKIRIDGVELSIKDLILYVNNQDINIGSRKKSDGNLTSINNLTLEGNNGGDYTVDIQHTKIHNISIDSFKNKGELHLSNLIIEKATNEENTLKLVESRLGVTTFKNINLSKFDKIKIDRTDLSTLKTTNASFVTGKNNIELNNDELYDLYNDLYTAAKNKNNKFEATEYYKASKNVLLENMLLKSVNIIKSHRYIISYIILVTAPLSLSILSILLQSKFLLPIIKPLGFLSVLLLVLPFFIVDNFASILSLQVSKIYSRFGTYFPQAILSTLIVSFGFFSLMVCFSEYHLEVDRYKFIAYWIQYINPVHKVSFMDKIIEGTVKGFSSNPLFVFFDFVGRIFISIGIFETVRSFRRFV